MSNELTNRMPPPNLPRATTNIVSVAAIVANDDEKNIIQRRNSILLHISSDLSDVAESDADTEKMDGIDDMKSDLARLSEDPMRSPKRSADEAELDSVDTVVLPSIEVEPVTLETQELEMANNENGALGSGMPATEHQAETVVEDATLAKNKAVLEEDGEAAVDEVEAEDEDDADEAESEDKAKKVHVETDEEGEVEGDVEGEVEGDVEGDAEDDEGKEDDQSIHREEVRQRAMEELADIEKVFARLREKLYNDKLKKLSTELQMCLEGSHPALKSFYEKIDAIRDSKLEHAYKKQKYELKCIDLETRATRVFIHQDYYKRVNDLKHDLLNNTTTSWYDINKERRDMDILVPDYQYHVPISSDAHLRLQNGKRYMEDTEDVRAENVKFKYIGVPTDMAVCAVDRVKLNKEIGELNGVNKFFGLPGAPELNSVAKKEVDDDLKAMGLR